MEIRPILSALLRNKTAPLLVAVQVALSLAILANALYIVNLRQASSSRPSGLAEERNMFTVTSKFVTKVPLAQALAQQKRDVACPARIARRGVGDVDQPDADVALRQQQRLLPRPRSAEGEPHRVDVLRSAGRRQDAGPRHCRRTRPRRRDPRTTRVRA